MARALKDLLSNNHPLFIANIAQLERATGNAGIDARLIGEILEKGHRIMRQLGLDPTDTTGKELYQALNAVVNRDDKEAEQLFDDAQYVLVNQGNGPISFNIHDIGENIRQRLSYEQRSVAHAQRKLRAELIRRYAEHERTHEDVVYQLATEAGLDMSDGKEYEETPSETRHSEGDTEMKPRILAIGDIFSDAFIKLNDNEAKVTKDADGTEWLGVKFGAKLPYDHVDLVKSVGPSPNAAVSFSRLGINAALMAFLGDDEVGQESLDYLRDQKVDTSPIVPEVGATSSYWYVLRYGADRTMLVKNEEYAYEWHEPQQAPDWIYLSQIGARSWQLHEELLAYLEVHPDVKLAFQPGTFHFQWGAEKLARVYQRSHIVVMNREEAMEVTGLPYDSIRDLANGLHSLGVNIVVITDGPNGSYASYDGKLVTIPNYPDPAPPLDRTGAGDAFASTVVAALALGESMETALTWAPINSAYVVQQIGAQRGLLAHQDIQQHLADAPVDYKVTELQD